VIPYEKHTLSNGLTVLLHRDTVSEMAAVNILYRVGSRDEEPHRTGFAHLFEHLMFRGTRRVPDFDRPVQLACGENNAFTTNDYTNFYITLPKENIETALWLEADRMEGLHITAPKLATEKRVVIEEFNQRYLNQPYGDMWMLLRGEAYRVHPYRWATIGLTPEHIAAATIEQVRDFYRRFYHPDNAILAIAANLDPDRMAALAEEWFGHIPPRPVSETERLPHGMGRPVLPAEPPQTAPRRLPTEPPQTSARRLEVERDVPADMLAIALRMGGRTDRDFYICDLVTDILAGGTSGRLEQALTRERRLFSSINAYATGDVDPGLLVITGNLLPGVALPEAETAVWEQLELLASKHLSDYELEKVKNKFEANTIYGELNVMNKAMNLAFYEMLGDLPLINSEVDIYRSITAPEAMECCRRIFRKETSTTLIYHAKR